MPERPDRAAGGAAGTPSVAKPQSRRRPAMRPDVVAPQPELVQRPEARTALRRHVALVLSGGIALGAFEAGAYAALEEAGEPVPDWLVGASIGAVNVALIAGGPPGQGAARLRDFWQAVASEPMPATTFLLGLPPPASAWRQAYTQAAALQALMLGRPGLFRPRSMRGPKIGAVPALYDLEPLRARLLEFVDFDRLNAGGTRVTVTATDVVSGERLVFDTSRGHRIGPEHIVASGALMPLFAPVEVEGRLLGDGGLSGNVPLDLVLDERGEGALLCFVLELFARDGSRPRTLAAAAARAADLVLGNQTRLILDGRVREHRLRASLQRLAARLPPDLRADPEIDAVMVEAGSHTAHATLVCLGYHAGEDEAGLGKGFDFSRATLTNRWEVGAQAMRSALQGRGDLASMVELAPGLLLQTVTAATSPHRMKDRA